MIALLLAMVLPNPNIETIRVDAIERNVVMGSSHQPSIDQYILKRFGRHDGVPDHYVSEWWLASGERYRRGDGRYEIRLWRGVKEIRIVTNSYRETETKRDPELRDRDRLPVDRRLPYLEDDVCE